MDKKDKKERIVVLIICLLMSIGLWFYVSNVENTIRKYDLNKVPVELLNVESLKDAKLALTPNQQFYVNLKLEGTSQIYKVKKEDFKITVDISEYALKKGENKMSVNIIEAPTNVTIKNNSNLNIIINLEEILEKTMEIVPEIDVTSTGEYFVSPVEIKPKEVKITGAESLVNRVEKVVVRGEAKGVTEDVIASYPIIPVDIAGKEVEGVELQNEYADVVIRVSKGRNIPVKINTIGELPSDLKLKSIEASRKTVEIIGPKEILDQIVEIKTEVVDLSKIKDNEEINIGFIVPDGVNILNGQEFVTVKVNVTKMISKDFEVDFKLQGIKDGLIITPVKNTVNVKVTAFEDQMNTVTVENIKAELNVESFKEEGTFEGTPIITLVGLDSTISVEPTEKIVFKITKEVILPENIVPEP